MIDIIYIYAQYRLNNYYIDLVKDRVNKFTQRKNLQFSFREWDIKKNKAVLFTMYSEIYTDIPLKLNCIFNFNNPNEYILQDFIIDCAVVDGLFPYEKIEIGYKHICFLSFDDKVPELLNRLNEFPNNNEMKYCILCNRNDLQSIKNKIYK